MSNAQSSDSPQVKLIHKLSRGFKEKNMDLVAETFHKDSRHITYPKTPNIPEKSRKEYLDYVGDRIAQ